MPSTHNNRLVLEEFQSYFLDSLEPFIASGGLPSSSSALTIDPFPTSAYVVENNKLIYVDQESASITIVDGTPVWLGIHSSRTDAVTGWTRQIGTHYIYANVSVQPVNPPGGLVFARVTVAGSVITLIENFAYRSPVDAKLGEHNIKSWGAVGDGATDDAPAIQSAINAAQVIRGKVVIPANRGNLSYNINSGFTISSPINIEGKGIGYSGDGSGPSAHMDINVDITIFTITRGASGSTIKNLYLRNLGASTLPAVNYINSNNNLLERMTITSFDTGVLFSPGVAAPQSSFLNTIRNSNIFDNTSVNIDGQSSSNALKLDNVIFGGGSSSIGLRLVDSNSARIMGCNVEGVTVSAIEFDATTPLSVAHTIIATHFEANTSSNGDIRLGATAQIRGVSIISCLFVPGATADSAINAFNVEGLAVLGGVLHSGYSGPNLTHTGFARLSSNVSDYAILGMGSTVENDIGTNFKSPSGGVFQPGSAFDASYVDSAQYNYFNINAADMLANSNYYGHLSVARADAGVTNPGAGSAEYAFGALTSNGHGGAANVRAIRAGAAFDMNNVNLTYGATIFPDTAMGNNFIIAISNTVAHTINAPINPGTGQVITFTLQNISGGVAGAATWNAVFKLAAWAQAANGFSRSITFMYNGTNWVEIGRTPADVPN